MPTGKPKSVSNALAIIWGTLVVCVAGAAANRALGWISNPLFSVYLLTYGLMAIIPYKLGIGRNWARYVYAVFTLLTAAMLFSGDTTGMTRLDYILSWLMLPVEIFVVYSLFRPEAGEWFTQAGK